MKSIVAALLITCLLGGCHKENYRDCGNDEKTFVGRWKYVEHFLSIGSVGTWKPAEPAGQIIEFSTDLSLKSSSTFVQSANHYEILDSVRIKLSPVANSAGYLIMSYQFANNGKELQLSPLFPSICIEGCSSKFIRE